MKTENRTRKKKAPKRHGRENCGGHPKISQPLYLAIFGYVAFGRES